MMDGGGGVDPLAGLTAEQKEVVEHCIRVLKNDDDEARATFAVLVALKERNGPTHALKLAQKAIEAWAGDTEDGRIYVLEVQDLRRRIAADIEAPD